MTAIEWMGVNFDLQQNDKFCKDENYFHFFSSSHPSSLRRRKSLSSALIQRAERAIFHTNWDRNAMLMSKMRIKYGNSDIVETREREAANRDRNCVCRTFWPSYRRSYRDLMTQLGCVCN